MRISSSTLWRQTTERTTRIRLSPRSSARRSACGSLPNAVPSSAAVARRATTNTENTRDCTVSIDLMRACTSACRSFQPSTSSSSCRFSKMRRWMISRPYSSKIGSAGVSGSVDVSLFLSFSSSRLRYSITLSQKRGLTSRSSKSDFSTAGGAVLTLTCQPPVSAFEPLPELPLPPPEPPEPPAAGLAPPEFEPPLVPPPPPKVPTGAPPSSVAGVDEPLPLLLPLPEFGVVPPPLVLPVEPVPLFGAVPDELGGGGLSPAVSSADQTVRKLSIECTMRSWSSRKSRKWLGSKGFRIWNSRS